MYDHAAGYARDRQPSVEFRYMRLPLFVDAICGFVFTCFLTLEMPPGKLHRARRSGYSITRSVEGISRCCIRRMLNSGVSATTRTPNSTVRSSVGWKSLHRISNPAFQYRRGQTKSDSALPSRLQCLLMILGDEEIHTAFHNPERLAQAASHLLFKGIQA